MYDAGIGRFGAIDPLADDKQESWNPYHYVFNNPTRFTDPTGLRPVVCSFKEDCEEAEEEEGARFAEMVARGQEEEEDDGKSKDENGNDNSNDEPTTILGSFLKSMKNILFSNPNIVPEKDLIEMQKERFDEFDQKWQDGLDKDKRFQDTDLPNNPTPVNENHPLGRDNGPTEQSKNNWRGIFGSREYSYSDTVIIVTYGGDTLLTARRKNGNGSPIRKPTKSDSSKYKKGKNYRINGN